MGSVWNLWPRNSSFTGSMVRSPARRGVRASEVITVLRNEGVLLESVKVTCSDCDRLTTSKSAKIGICSSPVSALEA